jgi:hypothetical protein
MQETTGGTNGGLDGAGACRATGCTSPGEVLLAGAQHCAACRTVLQCRLQDANFYALHTAARCSAGNII